MEKVLITGIAGGQGRLLARRLLENFEVCGVDRVGWEGAPRGVRVHSVDLRKKRFEDVIRTELPSAIVHMGFVRHFRSDERIRHGAAFPDEIYLERALARVKVEVEALGVTATDPHLLLGEVGGEDLLAIEGL